MIRFFYFAAAAILFFTTLMSDAELITENKKSSCLKCHEKTYMEAISNPYRHNVVMDTCTLCHVIQEKQNERDILLWSSTFQDEGLVYLGNLDKTRSYRIGVEVLDNNGHKSKPKYVNIKPEQTWKFPVNTSPLKKISGVKLEKVNKRIFAEAVISWNTNVPATSEIEYRTPNGKYRKPASSGNLFSRNHRVVLNGLKHGSEYIYKVISRDISGNTLQSGEYTLDTSKSIDNSKVPEQLKELPVNITTLRALRVEDDNDYYLKIATNRQSQYVVWMKEIEETAGRPCLGFEQNRYSTIEVCIMCHPQDASHPVGVRSKNPRIVVSTQLPTIEGGVITCVSCHYSHGGKKPYFVRIDFTREICIKCHKSYY